VVFSLLVAIQRVRGRAAAAPRGVEIYANTKTYGVGRDARAPAAHKQGGSRAAALQIQ
jgi:hypothetical protein